MKLYEVTDSQSAARVVVIAPDRETALELAQASFDADENYRSKPQSLEATCFCEDTSEPWCSRPSDGGIESPEPTWGEIDARGGDGWCDPGSEDETP